MRALATAPAIAAIRLIPAVSDRAFNGVIISERGGMPGAMDTMVQRGRFQGEPRHVEHGKHDGNMPLVGVNTFLPKDHGGDILTEIELIQITEGEKGHGR